LWWQVNGIAKLLFLLVTLSALAMVSIPMFQSWITWGWPVINAALSQRLLQALLDFVCFVVLFSQIIPISLRVALDVAKLVYKLQMTSDSRMPGLQVRSSTLPEELGGIEYLLTDKTGTLTRNEMRFRKLHIGSTCLSDSEASLTEVRQTLVDVLAAHPNAAFAPRTVESTLDGVWRNPYLHPAVTPADTAVDASEHSSVDGPTGRSLAARPHANGPSATLADHPVSCTRLAASTVHNGEERGPGEGGPQARFASSVASPPRATASTPGAAGGSEQTARSPHPLTSSLQSVWPFGPRMPPVSPSDGGRTAPSSRIEAMTPPQRSGIGRLGRGAGESASAGTCGADGEAVVQALLAIALCHNVSPVDAAQPEQPPPSLPPEAPLLAPLLEAGSRPDDTLVHDDGAGWSGGTGAAGGGLNAGANGGSESGGASGGSGRRSRGISGGSGGANGAGNGNDDGMGHFQGASPDELALVQFAARCGIVLVSRTPKSVTLREPSGMLREYEVLHEMPFSSELKRMGVLLRHQVSAHRHITTTCAVRAKYKL
jgi:magnesium-transporting ATPase (P-type)